MLKKVYNFIDIMAPHSSLTTLFVLALAYAPRYSLAVGTPFGLASATTGGGSATPATPSSNDELASWLSDDTARVIVLDSIFDFTSDEGTTTGTGCLPWTCSPNPQTAIDNGDCKLDFAKPMKAIS